MVNRETLSEHRSELRSDALPATTVDFFWDLNPRLAAREPCILTTKSRLLPCVVNQILCIYFPMSALLTFDMISVQC